VARPRLSADRLCIRRENRFASQLIPRINCFCSRPDCFLILRIPEACRQHRPRLIARLDRRLHLGSPLRSNRWRNNGSPLSPGCEDGSACPYPIPDVPQHRSCHEKRRSPKGNVIIRDGILNPKASSSSKVTVQRGGTAAGR
jgi:hypothetical protein